MVKRKVNLIAAGGGTITALVAKAATSTIPIVLAFGSDPVKIGLAASLNHPGGAQDDYARLPELAADLVRSHVAVIVAPQSFGAALAVKAATTTIPIVFSGGDDPVKVGLIESFNSPGGNVTGISLMTVEVVAKRLGLLQELLPGATHFVALVNPNSPITRSIVEYLQEAASTIRRQVEILTAGTDRDIDAAFATLEQKKTDALLISPDTLFFNRRVQLVTLAARYRIPVIYFDRAFTEIGGLISYGTSIAEVYRQIGIYVGRILKGEKPADLPFEQPTKFGPCCEPQYGQGDWPHDTSDATGERRQSDLAAPHMSAFGTKPTFHD